MTINEHDINQLLSHYKKSLNNYLHQINAKYEQTWISLKCQYQINKMHELLNQDIIKIENDYSLWRSNYIRENNIIDNEIMPPLVTNGKYYNDNKIHIHPLVCTSSDELFTTCEELIFFELMKVFINPEPMDERKNHSLKNINNYITDGLTAYCMSEINEISSEQYKIPSKYEANLEYIKTIFSALIDNKQKDGLKYELMFKGSMEQIISYTTNSYQNSIEIYKDFKSKYPTGIIPKGEILRLTKEPETKAGYLSSLLYAIIIIIAGIIISFLIRK